MKKIKLTILLLLLTIKSFSQGDYPRVEKIVTEDKILKGYIDKYSITIYLKFKNYSNNHLGVYSVEGWYYYDKVKSKIPLTGIYEYSELVLYNFETPERNSELLNFEITKKNHWEDVKYYKNIEDYNEKIVITKSESYWRKNEKKLELRLNDDNFKIRNVNEILLLNPDISFDLHNFGSWTWSFEIFAQKSNKIILKYSHPSRLYVQGRCGAALEEGLIFLEFSNKNKLIQFEKFIINSCNEGIYSEELEKVEKNLKEYKCYENNENSSYFLKIDLEDIKITKTKPNKV
jgi:hypothetical protein